MAVRYGFFNSVNGDRKYDVVDISSIFDGIIEDGVFATIGEFFAVTPGEGLQVIVGTGKAWFNHTWTINDAQLPLELEQADITLSRIDAIVLEVNNEESVRANQIKVVRGTASSSPVRPALTKTEYAKQYALAYVTVQASASSIEDLDIANVVGQDETPFVTGPLEVVPIDELYSKWNGEFNAWFEDVKTQLGDDVAGNLLNKINAVDKKVDSNWNKTLSSGTKYVLGLKSDATPDDAFLTLSLGVGKYGYLIRLLYPNKEPVIGMTLTGGTDPSGKTPTTNELGEAVIVSESASINVGLGKELDYIDIAPISGKNVESTGPLTEAEFVLGFRSEYLLTKSGTHQISDMIATYDVCAVGGGGGGTCGEGGSFFGKGGGGGYAVSKNNIRQDLSPKIKITIGAGGQKATMARNSAGAGGTTQVYGGSDQEELLCQANGGGGSTYTGGQYVAGVGNGDGQPDGYYGGSTASGYNGLPGTVHRYDDPDFDLIGGGGGGVIICYGSNANGSRSSGGHPSGGSGAFQRNQSSAILPGTDGLVPGGGGGAGYSAGVNYQGGNGGAGGVWVRFHPKTLE